MTENLNGKKVVLIDGSGYIFRAFYALPSMTRADGTPVNAVYGFCTMTMKLLKDIRADYLAVVFDAARKTFRQDIYPEYKATRKAVPEELIPQFPLLRDAVRAFNISAVELEGYEADDLLATYARQAQNAGADVTIVSADKDLMQLVGSGIVLFDPMKQKQIDIPQVLEKFGVSPDKVVDVQSLAGDSTDNVPGVSGIGVKTASLLINQYGSLDNLLAHAEEIPQKKRRETLIAEKEKALISRQLVRLNDASPVTVPLRDFIVKPVDNTVLKDFFEKQSFKSLASKIDVSEVDDKKLERQKQTSVPDVLETQPENFQPDFPAQTIVQTVTDFETLKSLLKSAEIIGKIALYAETDDFVQTKTKPLSLSFCFEAGKAFYVPVNRTVSFSQADLFSSAESSEENGLSEEKILSLFIPLLKKKTVLKIGHDIKRLAHLFSNDADTSVFPVPFDDTAVLIYALDGTTKKRDLIDASAQQTGFCPPSAEDICGKGAKKLKCSELNAQTASFWAGQKADAVFRLHTVLKYRLIREKCSEIYECFDRPLIPILFDMERRGICVDETELNRLSRYFSEKLTTLEQQIYHEAGEEFNINSPAQLAVVLFDKMGLFSAEKTSKTKARSTDASVLQDLADKGVRIASLTLQWRQFSKLKSTYSDALLAQMNKKSHRVHTEFLQTGTSTGRLASNDPNLQNIPVRTDEGRAIRKTFVAPKGFVLLSADYSQVELRLMAHVADVKALKQAFENGLDIHTATASHMFNIPAENMDPMIRRRAKAINFGIIYGISAFGLANQLGISRSEAKEYIDAYFAKYPEIKEYMNDTIDFARTHGYVLTPFNRKCFTPEINDKNASRRAFSERSAINAPIQGGAADILKKAMIRLPDALKETDAELLLQVHDELILQVPEHQTEQVRDIVKNVMENTTVLSVPLLTETGIGRTWDEAH